MGVHGAADGLLIPGSSRPRASRPTATAGCCPARSCSSPSPPASPTWRWCSPVLPGDGVGAFLVETSDPGWTTGRPPELLAFGGVEPAPVFLDGVRVGAEGVVGDAAAGFDVMLAGEAQGRCGLRRSASGSRSGPSTKRLAGHCSGRIVASRSGASSRRCKHSSVRWRPTCSRGARTRAQRRRSHRSRPPGGQGGRGGPIGRRTVRGRDHEARRSRSAAPTASLVTFRSSVCSARASSTRWPKASPRSSGSSLRVKCSASTNGR